MAGESPPCRGPPSAGRLARLSGSSLRAGGRIAVLCPVRLLFPIAPSIGHFLVVRSTAKGTLVMTPLRQRMMEDLQIRNYAPLRSKPTSVELPTSPSTLANRRTDSAPSRSGSINCS
jgi:hypothetical protein